MAFSSIKRRKTSQNTDQDFINEIEPSSSFHEKPHTPTNGMNNNNSNPPSTNRKKSRSNRKKSTSSSKEVIERKKMKDSTCMQVRDERSSATNDEQGKKNPPLNYMTNGVKTVLNPPLDLILLGEKRQGLYECDYCRKDISQIPRIRCAVCPDFDLCLECFSTTDPSAANTHRNAAAARMALKDPAVGEGTTDNNDGIIVSLTEKDKKKKNSGEKDTGFGKRKFSSQSGIITQHDSSHGYRVTDSTRFPVFSSSKLLLEKDKSSSTDSTSQSSKNHSPSIANSNSISIDGLESKNADDKCSIIKESSQENSTNTNNNGASKKSNDTVSINDEIVEDVKHVWTVEEDLRLLDAIATMGLGNWADISELVSGSSFVSNGLTGTKSAKRCMERYFDEYLGRFGHILPPYVLVEVEEKDSSKNSDSKDNSSKELVADGSLSTKRKKRRSDCHSSLPSSSSQNNKTKRYRRIPTSSLPNYEHIWPEPYIPPIGVQMDEEVNRDVMVRTEKSYVNALSNTNTKEEADKLREVWIKKHTNKRSTFRDPVFPPRLEDIKVMKGCELSGYMPRRGDFDVEYENEAENILADMEFSPNDHPAERALKLQIIRIYNSKLDAREQRKKFLIDYNLLDYRANQLAEQKLQPDERDLMQRMRLFARFHSPEEHTALMKNALKSLELRKKIALLQFYRRMGITSLVEAEAYELDKRRREHHKSAVIQKQKEERQQMLKDLKANSNSSLTETDGSKRVERNRRRRNPLADVDENEKKENNTTKEIEKDKKEMESKQEQNNKFIISDETGIELLSCKEIDLCNKLRLLPKYYLQAKKELILQSLKAGFVKKDNVLVKIDVEKRDDIIDFVMKNGWIPGKP